jgi:hypothetical protein
MAQHFDHVDTQETDKDLGRCHRAGSETERYAQSASKRMVDGPPEKEKACGSQMLRNGSENREPLRPAVFGREEDERLPDFYPPAEISPMDIMTT